MPTTSISAKLVIAPPAAANTDAPAVPPQQPQSILGTAIQKADRDGDGWVNTEELQALGGFPAFSERAADAAMSLFTGSWPRSVNEQMLREQLFNRLADLMPSASARPGEMATNAMEWFRLADTNLDSELSTRELGAMLTGFVRENMPTESTREIRGEAEDIAGIVIAMLNPAEEGFPRRRALGRDQMEAVVNEIVRQPEPANLKDFLEQRTNQAFGTFRRPLGQPAPEFLGSDEIKWIERLIASTNQQPTKIRLLSGPTRDADVYVVDHIIYANVHKTSDADSGLQGWYRVGVVPGALA